MHELSRINEGAVIDRRQLGTSQRRLTQTSEVRHGDKAVFKHEAPILYGEKHEWENTQACIYVHEVKPSTSLKRQRTYKQHKRQ